MNDDEANDFTLAMISTDHEILDICDAFVAAMKVLRRSECPLRYFGAVAGGTCYLDTEYEHSRWYPDCSPAEARCLLTAEFGESFTDELPAF